MTNFRLFQIERFADDNSKFEENGRKLSKQVENALGKGEIARYEQFLLFPHFFQKACFPGASEGVIVWEWVTHGFIVGFFVQTFTIENKLSPYIFNPIGQRSRSWLPSTMRQ